MATPSTLPSFLLLFFLLFVVYPTPTLSQKTTYIVHVLLSHKPATFASPHEWYSSILNSLSSTTSDTTTDILYTYTHSATGFAAHITASQAAELSRLPYVLSVVPDYAVEPATTRTPSFMGLSDEAGGLWQETKYGSDVIVGVVDSGIWPKSRSFNGKDLDPVPTKWKGTCEVGPGFPASSCNRKIIGARSFYKGYEAQYGPLNRIRLSAKDTDGHGTHCAGIAAGSAAPDAGYNHSYGHGKAHGVAPKARIAVYKVFWPGNTDKCVVSDIVKAIDEAISDGVDVISLSIASRQASQYFEDLIATAAFRAVQRGILVSTAAGNHGPGPSTVDNVSPWMLTVAASSIDRQITADVVLGNGSPFTGSTLYDFWKFFPTNNCTQSLTLVTCEAAGSQHCIQGQLTSRVDGKIVICEAGKTDPVAKSLAVSRAGGYGMIFVDQADMGEQLEVKAFVVPALTVTNNDGVSIKAYVDATSTSDATAQIVFKGSHIGPSPSAPRLAAFSSRGPNPITPEILKPDVTAPGLNILAAWSGMAGPSGLKDDPRRVDYNYISGTSMACPYVSGLGALLKQAHPCWSPAAIKSAIMTTSYNVDNANKKLVDLSTGMDSSPFVHGSGHIDPNKAVDPGLVYDLDTKDYIAFLCSIGYNSTLISMFVQDSSPEDCKENPLSSPGDLNYPSFSVVFKSATPAVKYTRVVKNVGQSANAVYRVSVTQPEHVQVKVSPMVLVFNANQITLPYTVTFTSTGVSKIPSGGLQRFGSIEWSDGAHHVRSPISAYWQFSGVQEDFVASI